VTGAAEDVPDAWRPLQEVIDAFSTSLEVLGAPLEGFADEIRACALEEVRAFLGGHAVSPDPRVVATSLRALHDVIERAYYLYASQAHAPPADGGSAPPEQHACPACEGLQTRIELLETRLEQAGIDSR
jgi:hypothetical protein